MGTITGNINDGQLRLVPVETSSNASNYTVQLSLVAVRSCSKVSGTMRIGGSEFHINVAGSYDPGDYIYTSSRTIPYDAGASSDTCTIAFSGRFTITNLDGETEQLFSNLLGYYTSYKPVTASLTTNKNSLNLGETVRISGSGGVSGTLKWKIGSSSGNVGTLNNGGYIDWTPSIANFSQYISSKSATCVLSWGAATKSITLNVPNNASTKPSCSVTLTNVDAFNNYLIKTKSKIKATVTCSGNAGASINAISVEVNGTVYSIEPSANPKEVTSDYLLTHGNGQVCSVTVTDSRGFTNTATATYDVRDYDSPTISNINAFRSNSSGSPLDAGTYLTVKFTPTISSLNASNARKFLVQYKLTTSSSWTPDDLDSNYSNCSSYTAEQTKTVGGSLSTTALYDVRVIIKDSFEKVTSGDSGIAGEDVMMDFNSSGNGGGIGMYNQGSDLLDLAWQLVAHKGIRGPGSNENAGRLFVVPRISNSGTGISSSNMWDEAKEWLKALCAKSDLNNIQDCMFVGAVVDGSRGFCAAYIYDTSDTDSTTRLPKNSFGLMIWYSSSGDPRIYTFGTRSYVFYAFQINTTLVT